MSAFLLDTGPVVASLDRSDPYHRWVIQRFNTVHGRVVTTGAIITEAAFFLQEIKDGIRKLIGFIEASRLEIWDCFSIPALRSAEMLMATYEDAPMDFADATLVLAAEHFHIGTIATLDERGFRTFRYGRNKAFQLLLQEDPT